MRLGGLQVPWRGLDLRPYGFLGGRIYAFPRRKRFLRLNRPLCQSKRCALTIHFCWESCFTVLASMRRVRRTMPTTRIDSWLNWHANKFPNCGSHCENLDRSLTELDGQPKQRLQGGEKAADALLKPEQLCAKSVFRRVADGTRLQPCGSVGHLE
jgi:hypothetical protein